MSTHSRALWELATCAGTEQATTTFHTKYNKHRPAERPYALGFLTRGRFLRFAQTGEGYALLRVDCSRPGAGGGDRQNFIRSVCSDFFNLCVEKSKTNEVQEGDYSDVGAARNMRSDTFCTFPGWCTAIASSEFEGLRLQWQEASVGVPQLSPPSSPSQPSSSTSVVVGVPVEVAVEAPPPPPPSPTQSAPKHSSKTWPNDVVSMDTSDDEEAPPLPKAIRPRGPRFEFGLLEPAARKSFADGMRNGYHRESREWTKSNSGAVEFYTFDEWIEQRWSRLSNVQLAAWYGAAKRELEAAAPNPPPPPSPAPAPAPAPASKKRRRGSNPITTNGTESWSAGCLGFVLIRDYDALKARGTRGELTFDSNHEHRGASYAGGHTLLITQRQLGKSAKLTDGYVLLDDEAASRVRHATRSKPKLRSVPDIVKHFNSNPDLNVASFLQ